jgi:hypothetical protein
MIAPLEMVGSSRLKDGEIQASMNKIRLSGRRYHGA